jgi:prophage tail gpP-like protein
MKNYTVVPGDTLRGLAIRFYGDETKWRLIYNANREIIGSNPDLIIPGTGIQIPLAEEKIKQQAPKPEIQNKKAVTVFLNGREIHATQGRAAFAVDSIASSFNCDCLWTPGKDAQFDKDTSRGSYADASLYLFGKLAITGRLYTRTNRIGTDGVTKNLVFYSATKDLVDTSLGKHSASFQKATLQQIAKEVCGVHGFKTKFPDGDGGEFLLVEGIPTYETAGKFLQKLAAAKGFFVSCDETSALVFQKLHTSEKPVANIDITGRIATEYAVTFDDTLRFNNYAAVSVSGDGKEAHSKSFIDEQVPGARQFVFEASDSDAGNLDLAAEWAAIKITLQANEIKIPSDKWVDANGDLWKTNSVISLKSPVLDIPESRKYIIRGVEFAWTANSRSAELSLVPILSVDGSGKLVME